MSHSDDSRPSTVRTPPAIRGSISEEAVQRLLANPALFVHVSDIVSILDRDLHFQYIDLLGDDCPGDEYIGESILHCLMPSSHDSFQLACEQAFAAGRPRTILAECADARFWEARLVPVQNEDGTPFMFMTCVDITERKRAEDALSERENSLRCALEASGVGTWSWERGRDVIAWDDSLCRIFGLNLSTAPTTYAMYLTHVHPEDRARVETLIERCLNTGIYDDFEHRLIRPDGEVRHVFCRGTINLDADGQATSLRGGVLDITDRKRLEEQLRHVQKMEAVGQLTAGIAHNFNNLLSIMLPNVELCREVAPSSMQARLSDIEHAAERARELVRQLMRFARHEIGAQKDSCDLGAIAQRTASICRATFDRRITIDVYEQPKLPPVMVRPGEIEQVLLNLCINARDAFDEAQTLNPHIEIRVEHSHPASIRVRVIDNGPGIDPLTQPRLFEPFFTTKDVSKGTGLGLASAYGIVVDHQGNIGCESTPGHGCTFTIELPAAQEAAYVQQPEPEILLASCGTETILLIDDEPLVRRALRAVLEHAGFTVLEAGDGDEGLATLARPDATVDLIVLDRSMPHMSGEDFLTRWHEGTRRLPIVLLTGQPGSEPTVDGVTAVIAKPPRASELLRTLRKLLDTHAPSTRSLH